MAKFDIVTNLLIDASKIADKKDYFKDFLNEHDELLSTSSWGKFIGYLGRKAIEIEDLDSAYYFTIFTAYMDSFKAALDQYGIVLNNISIPNRTNLEFSYLEFDKANVLSNPLLKYFHEVYQELLESKDIAKEDITKIQKYINNYLKYNYLKVLDENPSVLNKYIKHTTSEIYKEEQNLLKKELYNSKIEKEYSDIVLGDEKGLTLKDLYIEPFFRVHKSKFAKDDERLKERYEPYIDLEEDVSVHSFVEDILNGENKFDLEIKDLDTIFISGYPGQGKSSFTKRFVNDIINDKNSLDKEVILIKLKDIEDQSDFLNKKFADIVKETIPFEVDSLDNYIVVLDGLDELIMKSSLSITQIDNICENLSRSKIKKIITTRHNYVNFDKLYEKNILILSLKELSQEQQLEWLTKYKLVHAEIGFSSNTIKELHKNETDHILELINQPILLHMIVSMDIEEIKDYDRSSLYKKFFDILIERNWENKEKHTLLDGIDEKKAKRTLREMLRETAHYIFNSEFEYINKIDFENLKSVKKFQELLVSKNNDSLKDNLKGVMVSFYFKEVERDQEDIRNDELNENYAIEFLHKSLMEYMSAEYVWERLQDLLEKDRYDEYINDEKKALKLFCNILDKKILSKEVIQNLVEIIENQNKSLRNEISLRLDSFMNYFIDKEFIFESKEEDKELKKKSVTTFYGFWNILLSLDDKNHMPQIKNKKIIEFIKVITTEYYLDVNLDHTNLSEMYMGNLYLENVDFFKSELINTRFSNSSLSDIDFSCSKLSNVMFDCCHLWNIVFGDNIKRGLSFPSSNIHYIKFIDSSIMDADWTRTNFLDSIFINVIFDNVDFSCSYFQSDHETSTRSTFENVEFRDCFFNNTVFHSIEFRICLELDFEELKEQGAVFINCTHNGETI